MGKLFPKKSAATLIPQLKKKPLPRLLRSPLRRKKMSKWSLSANPDTEDMVDTDMDMVVMDTTTARKLPKQLPTMCPLSPPSMSPSLSLPYPCEDLCRQTH